MKTLAGVLLRFTKNRAILPGARGRDVLVGFHLLLATLVGLACNTSSLVWLNSVDGPDRVETPQQFSIKPNIVESGSEQLRSYRADYRLSYDGVRGGQRVAGEIVQTILVEGQLRNISQVITSSGAGISQVEYYETGDRVYVDQDEDRFWFEEEVIPDLVPEDVGIWPMQRLILLPDYVSQTPQTDSWNGNPVQGFSFTETDLSNPQLDFETARGRLQINPNGNYLVTYSLTGTMELVMPLRDIHLVDRGKVAISYTLSQPDATKVTSPSVENSVRSTLASLPRPEDAQITVIYPALLEYSSVISPISATLFYGDILSQLGWTQTLTDVFNEKARLGFEKDAERISVIVVPDVVTNVRKITLSLDKNSEN
jgi:hypothetical protein